MADNEKRIAELMAQLGCSREEAIDIIAYDDDVEDGKKTEYDLTPEQEANVRSMNRKVEHKKGQGQGHNRKPNETKEAVVKEIAEFLAEDAQGQVYEEVKISNPNRMISFIINGKAYELTLIEKRTPK